MQANTFYADDKFADVIEQLRERGWRRASCITPTSTFTWSNYSRIRFDQLRKGYFVNHLRGIDVLSNKAKFAKLVEKHGLSRLVPPTWSHLSGVSLEEFVFDPALHQSDGTPTYWIVKPAGLSCGRGIEILQGEDAVLQHVRACNRGGRSSAVVVQQYVSKPLLLFDGRKFDIRQWVLITSLEPLQIYGFSECYARLCSEPFRLQQSELQNRFAHLTNYAVQKEQSMEHSSEFSIPGNMFTQQELSDTLREKFGRNIFDDELAPRMKEMITNIVSVAVAQRGSEVTRIAQGFEWLGFDILIDEDLQMKVLEVNVSPDMSHSTSVTTRLVPQATRAVFDMLFDDSGAGDEQHSALSQDGSLRWVRWL